MRKVRDFLTNVVKGITLDGGEITAAIGEPVLKLNISYGVENGLSRSIDSVVWIWNCFCVLMIDVCLDYPSFAPPILPIVSQSSCFGKKFHTVGCETSLSPTFCEVVI